MEQELLSLLADTQSPVADTRKAAELQLLRLYTNESFSVLWFKGPDTLDRLALYLLDTAQDLSKPLYTRTTFSIVFMELEEVTTLAVTTV